MKPSLTLVILVRDGTASAAALTPCFVYPHRTVRDRKEDRKEKEGRQMAQKTRFS